MNEGISPSFFNKKTIEQVLYRLSFSLIWTLRWNLQSNTLYDFRLEDATNLSGTILLLIIEQMYEFQGKSEKRKKAKLWITTENKKK